MTRKRKKEEIDQEAHNLLVLNLSNQVLRTVSTETTILKLCTRLVALYYDQQAPNLAYLKVVVFAFRMATSKTMDENFDEFLIVTLMLASRSEPKGCNLVSFSHFF